MKSISIIKRTPLRQILSSLFIICMIAAFIVVLSEDYISSNFDKSADSVALVLILIAILSGFIISFTKGHLKIGELNIDESTVHFNLKNNADFDRNINDVYLHILTQKDGYFRWWAWFRALIPQFAGKKNYVRFEKDGHIQRLELYVPNDRSHEFMNNVGIKRDE